MYRGLFYLLILFALYGCESERETLLSLRILNDASVKNSSTPCYWGAEPFWDVHIEFWRFRQIYSFRIFSSISTRPEALGEISPFSSMYLLSSVKPTFPFSMSAPMLLSQLA
ncbi:MAG: hypothetical protein BWY71_00385 [Planctomycetes bacterium ADurb.Bin412]|nr:MAG: hypothetical protein BWY71_00385 [Planctomycetes bacterium ADurb.Bin412]